MWGYVQWDGQGHFIVRAPGLSDTVSLRDLSDWISFWGGTWLLSPGQTALRLLLPDLRNRDATLSGHPGRIFGARWKTTDGRWVFVWDADPALGTEVSDPDLAYSELRILARLRGSYQRPPRSCGSLLSARMRNAPPFRREPYPARGQRFRMPAGSRQQLFAYEAEGEIRLYDLISNFAWAAVQFQVPTGPGQARTGTDRLNGDCPSDHCEIVECEVRDESRYGLLPQRGADHSRYGRGMYTTTVARPLLSAALQTGAVRLLSVQSVIRYRGYDLSPVVRHGWDQRIRAARLGYPAEERIWRRALQQFLGKFSERPVASTYQFDPPEKATGHHLVDWDLSVWSTTRRYYPPLYHPTAGAWIRQCAQIPLLRPLVEQEVLRVYVDSIVLRNGTLPTGDGLGDWRFIAGGGFWQARGAGECRILEAETKARAWSCGPWRPALKIVEKNP